MWREDKQERYKKNPQRNGFLIPRIAASLITNRIEDSIQDFLSFYARLPQIIAACQTTTTN
jgi:hypothetical protein